MSICKTACIVHTDYDEAQLIEEGVVVGHRAVLHGRFIGRDTLVGMGALLLSQCEIGAECIIAAGTLITEKRRIPPRSLVMGVPGRVVREVSDDDLRRTHAISAHYLELAQRYVHGAFPRRGSEAADYNGWASWMTRICQRKSIPVRAAFVVFSQGAPNAIGRVS